MVVGAQGEHFSKELREGDWVFKLLKIGYEIKSRRKEWFINSTFLDFYKVNNAKQVEWVEINNHLK